MYNHQQTQQQYGTSQPSQHQQYQQPGAISGSAPSYSPASVPQGSSLAPSAYGQQHQQQQQQPYYGQQSHQHQHHPQQQQQPHQHQPHRQPPSLSSTSSFDPYDQPNHKHQQSLSSPYDQHQQSQQQSQATSAHGHHQQQLPPSVHGQPQQPSTYGQPQQSQQQPITSPYNQQQQQQQQQPSAYVHAQQFQSHHQPQPHLVQPMPSTQAQHQQYGGHGQTHGPSIDDDRLRDFFESVDSDRSGSINAEELKTALSNSKVMSFSFSDECAQMMIRMFDRTGDRVIDYSEFQQLHKFLMRMRDAYDEVDTDRSGSLDFNEVCNALQCSGFTLSPQTVQTVFRKFDRNRTNALGLDGYIEMCVFLDNVHNTFSTYDPSRSGSAWFSVDSFVAASTNLV